MTNSLQIHSNPAASVTSFPQQPLPGTSTLLCQRTVPDWIAQSKSVFLPVPTYTNAPLSSPLIPQICQEHTLLSGNPGSSQTFHLRPKKGCNSVMCGSSILLPAYNMPSLPSSRAKTHKFSQYKLLHAHRCGWVARIKNSGSWYRQCQGDAIILGSVSGIWVRWSIEYRLRATFSSRGLNAVQFRMRILRLASAELGISPAERFRIYHAGFGGILRSSGYSRGLAAGF